MEMRVLYVMDTWAEGQEIDSAAKGSTAPFPLFRYYITYIYSLLGYHTFVTSFSDIDHLSNKQYLIWLENLSGQQFLRVSLNHHGLFVNLVLDTSVYLYNY